MHLFAGCVGTGSATTYFQLVLLPVDDDGSNLLVHEDKDGAKECWRDSCRDGPDRVRERVHNPTTFIRCWLQEASNGQNKGPHPQIR